MTPKKNYKDYESALERLEEITTLLESGEKTLEESITLYTEGMELAKLCNDKLKDAEKKITLITEKNKNIIETEFDSFEE